MYGSNTSIANNSKFEQKSSPTNCASTSMDDKICYEISSTGEIKFSIDKNISV